MQIFNWDCWFGSSLRRLNSIFKQNEGFPPLLVKVPHPSPSLVLTSCFEMASTLLGDLFLLWFLLSWSGSAEHSTSLFGCLSASLPLLAFICDRTTSCTQSQKLYIDACIFWQATNKRGKETFYTAAKFILATGERPRYLGIPGDKEYCITR